MENISNPKCDWTIHSASNIAPTITGTINATTTATAIVIAKSNFPTEPTIPTQNHTTTIVLPTLRFSLNTLPITGHTITKIHYIIANHQIAPLQRSLLVPKYTI
jgi:hypothetical protein